MKTFILASLLALTAVSGAVVASQPAAAGIQAVGGNPTSPGIMHTGPGTHKSRN